MRSRTHEVSVIEPITLADLRWLVDQTATWSEGSRVAVKGRRDHGQLDFDPAEITVNGADQP
jgi:hypothetical protein